MLIPRLAPSSKGNVHEMTKLYVTRVTSRRSSPMRDVRFTPNSGHSGWRSACLLCAISGDPAHCASESAAHLERPFERPIRQSGAQCSFELLFGPLYNVVELLAPLREFRHQDGIDGQIVDLSTDLRSGRRPG